MAGPGHAPAMPPVVFVMDPAHTTDLKGFLAKGGFKFEPRPHHVFLALRPGVNVALYASGKIVLSGKQAEEYALVLQRTSGIPLKGDIPTPGPAPGPRPRPGIEVFKRRIGMDESGKGDYFGPLVAAAVLIPDEATEALLREKGVRDSKRVPDATALVLDSLIRSRCPHEVVVLPPAKYNEVYGKVGNLNRLLAWAHARALEDLLARNPCELAILDQFAKDPSVVDGALFERGRGILLQQAVRAEDDLAVAAASLVARAEFLRSLRGLAARFDLALPKGAGPTVEETARAFVRRHGRAALGEVAKLHFATTARVEGHGGPLHGLSDREEPAE